MVESIIKGLVESKNGLVVFALLVLLLVVLLIKYWCNVTKVAKAIYGELTRGARLEKLIGEVSTKVNVLEKDLKYVKGELDYNSGSSVKDATRRIEDVLSVILSRDDFKFRKEKFPAFECDSFGRNTRVTNAYLELLDLRLGGDLSHVDWLGFIHKEDRESYLAEFKYQAETGSNFSHPARFLNSKREYVGEWLVQAAILSGGSYYGVFIPLDDKAKEIFKAKGWVTP